MDLSRNSFLDRIDFAFRNHQAVALLGPRQAGKTTLSRAYTQQATDFQVGNYFDLEDSEDISKLQDPKLALSQREGLIVLDEIQRVPEIFTALRVLIDNPALSQRFLILGSASRDLVQQASETLAGRIRYIELTPFVFPEVGNLQQLWCRGGFPKSYLAETDEDSYDWRKGYISTFLERDIPRLGFNIPPAMLRRFWLMLAHYHGGLLNASEIGRSMAISDTSVKRYLDILEGTFMVRQLTPWHENLGKRQVKSPKIYLRDSGIYHVLLGIKNHSDLLNHPKLGASWEGMAIESLISHYQATPEECFFWATHQGAELDLLIGKDGQRMGFEVKYSLQPKLTRSMQQAKALLKLDTLQVITPGSAPPYPLSDTVRAVGLEFLLSSSGT